MSALDNVGERLAPSNDTPFLLEPLPPSGYAANVTSAVRSRVFVDGLGAVGGTRKRLADLFIASVALILLAPLMIILCALVKLAVGGPILYRHTRIGLGGIRFECYKFRTMAADADGILIRHLAHDPEAAREWSEHRKLRDDPRVTMFGRILRKSSLDELPQLFNVLKGEMSCVGPRPIVSAELARYGPSAVNYLQARPGITGIWQVSGRNSLRYEERVALDTHYVKNWSLGMDWAILAKTIVAVLEIQNTS